MQKVRSTTINKHLKEKKRILKLDKAQNEEWESYKTKLEEVIMKELGITDKLVSLKDICKDKDLDKIWDIISNSSISSTYAMLPSQKVAVCRTLSKKTNESDKILKDLRRLGKICHNCLEKKGFLISEME